MLTILLLALPGAVSVLPAGEINPMSGRIAPCPDSPNCVSSDAVNPSHHVPHFSIILPINEAWSLVREAVKDMPRTEIVEITDNYLHVECTSAVFRFVDDIELELRLGDGIIAVRSASRKGYSDFGVNRRRVERLRDALRDRGVVR